MDENKNNETGYEPNFVLMDDPYQDTDSSPKSSNNAGHNDTSCNTEAGEGPSTNPTKSSGAFRDPRDNFKRSENNGYVNNASYVNNFTDGGSRPGDSHNKPKFKRERKPSPPVTLTRRTLVLIIVLCLITSSAFGIGGAYFFSGLAGGNQNAPSSVKTDGYTLEDATHSGMSVQEITEKAKNSVVEIKTESVSSDAWMQQYVTEGAGSGVIITEDGYIVTNNHVIEGASKISVTTSDEKEYDAKLIGADSNSDVAVLKISANDLTPAVYGNSDQLQVGSLAVAIGNPLGELGGTVTAGIISALDRQLSIDGKTMNLLQTDSSINPGNSGGGLFNDDGQLIGIVVAKSSGSDVEGLGFAIPINKAADVAQQLMKQGYVSGQPSTGMSYSEEKSKNLSYFDDSETAIVYIQEVLGSNAKKAGFKPGDIVYAVDDMEITCFDDLSSIVTAHKVGDKLTFTIVRNGHKTKLDLTLEEKTNN